MGLKPVSGQKVPANYAADRQTNVRDPLLLIYAKGRSLMTVRCLDLVAVTGANDAAIIGQVRQFAENLTDDEPWTKEQVLELRQRVGRMPFPKLVQVEHVLGQGTLLLKVAWHKGPGVTELAYPKGSNRPSFNLLPVLKDEGIEVPEGMCLEIPLALVIDDGILKVEARLLKGEERAVKQQDGDDGEESDDADAAADAEAEKE